MGELLHLFYLLQIRETMVFLTALVTLRLLLQGEIKQVSWTGELVFVACAKISLCSSLPTCWCGTFLLNMLLHYSLLVFLFPLFFWRERYSLHEATTSTSKKCDVHCIPLS